MSDVVRLPLQLDGEYGTSVALDLLVTYTLTPACRGSRDRYGAPLEPDEPEAVEIESAVLVRGDEIIDRAPDYDEAAVIAAILLDIEAQRDDARIDAYESRRDFACA